MAFDYSKLRGRIIEKYGTLTAFASAIKKSEQSMYKKLGGEYRFSQEDVVEWAKLLEIEESEYAVYFFKLKV